MKALRLAHGAPAGIAAALTTLGLLAVPAQAALLVNQAGSALPGFTSANPNGVDGAGRAVFDDFMVGSDFTLTRVEWTGGTVSNAAGVDPASAPPVQFLLSIRADDGTGKPNSAPLVSLTAGFETIAGSVLSSSAGAVVYRYGLDLSAVPSLGANTRYWLQITALFSGTAQSLSWDWSAGAGGNGIGSYYDSVAASYINTSGDRSFSLIGDERSAVPEPHGAALLLLALASAALVSRRRNHP